MAWSNKDEGRIRSRGWAKGLNSMAATRNRTAAKPAITEAPTPIPELAVLEGEATWAEVTGAASRLMNVIMRETGIEDIRRQPESDHVIIVVEGEPAIVGAGAGEARNENARLHVVVGGRRPTALPVGRAWIDKSGEALAVGPSAEVARRTDWTFDTVHLFRRK